MLFHFKHTDTAWNIPTGIRPIDPRKLVQLRAPRLSLWARFLGLFS